LPLHRPRDGHKRRVRISGTRLDEVSADQGGVPLRNLRYLGSQGRKNAQRQKVRGTMCQVRVGPRVVATRSPSAVARNLVTDIVHGLDQSDQIKSERSGIAQSLQSFPYSRRRDGDPIRHAPVVHGLLDGTPRFENDIAPCLIRAIHGEARWGWNEHG